jgi:hypothetical protein
MNNNEVVSKMDIEGIQPIQYLITQNALFHYTKLGNAINYILHTNKLRLTPRKKQNDPFESTILRLGSGGFVPRDQLEYEQLMKKSNKIIGMIENSINNETRQISFCRNRRKITDNDSFGFMKTRMWDQYGEKYNGLCIAVDKKKILNQNGIINSEKWIYGDVGYHKFRWIENNSPHFGYELLNGQLDQEKIVNRYIKNWSKQLLFSKHKDYIDESEYRLCTFSKNHYEYIDINGCILAIFYCLFDDTKRRNKLDLSKLARISNIPIVELLWTKNHLLISPL